MFNPKWFILVALYVSQYIPLFFLMMGMPVFMRQQGMGLDAIGLTYLVILPFGLKFLWAPLIDRYSLRRFGHYRFWILFFQVLAILLTIAIAPLNLQTQFPLLIGLMLLLSTVCVTQDIAADALSTRMLEPQERGIGNGIQKSGNYAGGLIGGGVMLILLDRIGWYNAMISMAVMLAIGMIPILLIQESKLYQTRSDLEPVSYFQAFKQFFRHSGTWHWLGFMATYLAGVSMAYVLLRPLLVDRGLSLEMIGLVFGVIGLAMGAIGALFAGVLIVWMGRQRSLIAFGIFQAIAILTLIPPALGVSNVVILTVISCLFCAATAIADTILLTIAMDRCEAATAGSDFTIQASAIYLVGIAMSPIGGILGEKLGYVPTLLIAAGLTCLVTVWGAIEKFGMTSEQPKILVQNQQQ
ncbi:MFS transporter [Myxacorys almedinensis]|uniref:MFS transporter n=1 Tax=Myxacorys almedinensis A TaxID=2690445 RepID=A0A8J7Z3G0_9CYAN|nr:MFS transporter [Myxacorys almedinensis]NDJ18595.1 MFS transporter [Myxacorys almedinensis A]